MLPKDKMDKNFFQRRFNWSPNMAWKKILFSAVSALVIGTVIGLTMIRLFASSEIAPTEVTQVPTVDKDDLQIEEKDNPTDQTEPITIPQLQGFVVQLGIFSDEVNAEMMIQGLEITDITPIVWQQDGEYFVFGGFSSSEEKAKEVASKLEAQGVESYVKKWEAAEKQVAFNEADTEWVQNFIQLLQTSIEQGNISQEEWKKMGETEVNSEHLTPLINSIQSEVAAINTSEQANLFLLSIWHQLGQIE